MLTEEQIAANKERYIELISGITTEGADIERYLDWLSKSDFFEAPASTKYHCAYRGGLCQHCLNVYDSLSKLVNEFAYHYEDNPEFDKDQPEELQEALKQLKVIDYSEDSIRTVSLLHDLAKVNFYEQYNRNVKDDQTGQWKQVIEYRTKAAGDRFIYGNHEQTSEYMAHTFFPLSVEESVAILNHHGGKGFDSAQTDLTPVYGRYTLAVLLHLADMISTYVSEK